MVVNKNSYFGIDSKTQGLLKKSLAEYVPEQNINLMPHEVNLYLNLVNRKEDTGKKWVLSKSCESIWSKIKIDVSILPFLKMKLQEEETGGIYIPKNSKSIPEGYYKYALVNGYNFITHKHEHRLYVAHVYNNSQGDDLQVGFSTFKEDFINVDESIYTKNINVSKDFIRQIPFFQMFTFLRFSDIEEKYVKSGKKSGTKKNGVVNKSDSDFTYVTEVWNKDIIRTDGFGVGGHFRLQPYGEKRADRKLIYIKPFQKDGYVRKAKSRENE